MKALSLWQPWATAIARGLKRIETRGWATHYRGPLAIHAAARTIRRDDIDLDIAGALGWQFPLQPADAATVPLGAVVATCRLVTCYRLTGADDKVLDGPYPVVLRTISAGPVEITETEYSLGNYAPGRFAWVLADVVALPEPIPAKGGQGLWIWKP